MVSLCNMFVWGAAPKSTGILYFQRVSVLPLCSSLVWEDMVYSLFPKKRRKKIHIQIDVQTDRTQHYNILPSSLSPLCIHFTTQSELLELSG